MRVGLGLGLPFALSKIWSVLSQFVGAATGLVLDPSNNSTLFQDSTGSAAVTAVGQPSGLALDGKLGLARGPNLVTDSGFDSGTGWMPGAGWVIAGGVATATSTIINIRTDFPFIAGKTYEVTFDITGYTEGNLRAELGSSFGPLMAKAGKYACRLVSTTATGILYIYGEIAFTGSIDNVEAREVRGNHMLQATAAARPLVNARVNMLTVSTGFFSNWLDNGRVAGWADNYGVAPDGTKTTTYSPAGGTSYTGLSLGSSRPYTYSKHFKKTPGAVGRMYVDSPGVLSGSAHVDIDLQTLTMGAVVGGAVSLSIVDMGDFIRASMVFMSSAAGGYCTCHVYPITGAYESWGAQVDEGSVATRYQGIRSASNYDTVGFPQFLTFDAVDDNLATGVVTLGADMDCFIAVRRLASVDGPTVLSDATARFLFCVSDTTTSSGAASAGAGSPTYKVNGVSVPGDIATTRAQLGAASPLNTWVVLEANNANLSAWGTVGINSYTGARLAMDVGGIVLAPAGDAATRANNRRNLGAKVGLVL